MGKHIHAFKKSVRNSSSQLLSVLARSIKTDSVGSPTWRIPMHCSGVLSSMDTSDDGVCGVWGILSVIGEASAFCYITEQVSKSGSKKKKQKFTLVSLDRLILPHPPSFLDCSVGTTEVLSDSAVSEVLGVSTSELSELGTATLSSFGKANAKLCNKCLLVYLLG